MTPDQILAKIGEFVAKGDEAGARDFILNESSKFPEDLRDELVFQFSVNALLKDVGENKPLIVLQQHIIDAVEKLKKDKEDVENQIRIIDLQNQLQK